MVLQSHKKGGGSPHGIGQGQPGTCCHIEGAMWQQVPGSSRSAASAAGFHTIGTGFRIRGDPRHAVTPVNLAPPTGWRGTLARRAGVGAHLVRGSSGPGISCRGSIGPWRVLPGVGRHQVPGWGQVAPESAASCRGVRLFVAWRPCACCCCWLSRLTSRTDVPLAGAEHPGDAAHAGQPADGGELVIGTLRLCLARRELIGPHGCVRLAPVPFLLAEMLMRQGGAVVDVNTLSRTLHAASDCRTEQGKLQDHMQVLRGAVNVLTRERAQLRQERGAGYTIEARR